MNECSQLMWLCAKLSLREAGKADLSFPLWEENLFFFPFINILIALGCNFFKISTSLIQLWAFQGWGHDYLVPFSLPPSTQNSIWNIINEKASQMPERFVPCLITLYSLPPQALTTNTSKLYTCGLRTIQGSSLSLKYSPAFFLSGTPFYPPPKSWYFFKNQLKFSLFQKPFIHPPQPTLSSANDSHPSHLALGIPSC